MLACVAAVVWRLRNRATKRQEGSAYLGTTRTTPAPSRSSRVGPMPCSDRTLDQEWRLPTSACVDAPMDMDTPACSQARSLDREFAAATAPSTAREANHLAGGVLQASQRRDASTTPASQQRRAIILPPLEGRPTAPVLDRQAPSDVHPHLPRHLTSSCDHPSSRKVSGRQPQHPTRGNSLKISRSVPRCANAVRKPQRSAPVLITSSSAAGFAVGSNTSSNHCTTALPGLASQESTPAAALANESLLQPVCTPHQAPQIPQAQHLQAQMSLPPTSVPMQRHGVVPRGTTKQPVLRQPPKPRSLNEPHRLSEDSVPAFALQLGVPSWTAPASHRIWNVPEEILDRVLNRRLKVRGGGALSSALQPIRVPDLGTSRADVLDLLIATGALVVMNLVPVLLPVLLSSAFVALPASCAAS